MEGNLPSTFKDLDSNPCTAVIIIIIMFLDMVRMLVIPEIGM